ncbi:MAG TPA: hypothetical protein VKS21_03750, partial [Spirochaetota bacterium]|nr:hypothetical protein [Spirochaetota bacterium]
MTEVLSQNEIDNLLAAVDSGGGDSGGGDSGGFSFDGGDSLGGQDSGDDYSKKTASVKMYDFKRPDKFSKDQIRTIQMMHETYARLTTTSLSALLRSFVNVHVASV